MFPLSCSRLGPMLLALDHITMGSSFSLRGLSCAGLPLLISDSARADPFTSIRSLARSEFMLFVLGLTRAGSVSSLSVIDKTILDSPLLARSLVHMGFVSFVSDYARMGSCLFLQSLTRADPLASAAAIARLDSILFALDLTEVGFFSSARSLTCLDFALLVLDLTNLELFLLLRTMQRFGLTVPMCGLCRLGSTSFTSGDFNMGSFMSLRSHLRLEPLVSALNHARLGLLPLLRSILRLGPILSVIGMCQMDSASFVLDLLRSGLSMFVRSLAYMDLVASVLDLLHLGPVLLARACAYLDFSFLLLAKSQFGSFPLVLDSLHPGLVLSVRSVVQMGFVLSAPDLLHLDLLTFLHSLS